MNAIARIIVFLSLPFAALSTGDVPPLEREITLSFSNEPVPSALVRLQDQAGVIFSYQPSVISGLKPVTASFRKASLRETLTTIFMEQVTFTTKKNYVILKRKPPAKAEKKKEVSGYVTDERSEQKLPNVTVYDPATLRSTTTDDFGYFSLEVPQTTSSLSIARQDYRDTTVKIESNGLSKFTLMPDTAFWKKKLADLEGAANKAFRDFKGYLNTLNVRDSIIRDWQVSFVPFVGTHHLMSGNVYNRLSFNILGGYTRGVSGFEAGGLFNINGENMRGAQLAGLLNVVGDSVGGFQAAGLMNISGKKQSGLQAAGLINVNPGRAEGIQLSGLMNLNGKTTGLAGAGLLNVSRITNGALIAGLGNISDTLNGFAAAGLFNATGRGRSVSVAGLFNTAEEADVQIAGLFNAAGTVRKTQISVLNFADTATGVPIGLFSVVRKGLHQVELSSDEWFYANLSYRSGVSRFYNILTLGYQPGSSATLWQIGYGLGTSFRISGKLKGELNLTAHHVSKGAFLLAPSQLFRFHPAIEYQVSRRFCVAAGPTFNLYHTDELMPEYDYTYSHVAPYTAFSNSSAGSYNQKGWVGGKISLRFL